VRRFAALYTALDETTSTLAKTGAMTAYLREAPPADAAWALSFLSGRRPKRLIRTALLQRWAREAAGIPEWLFDESYQQVGDLAETISLLVPDHGTSRDESLDWWVRERILALRDMDEARQREAVEATWRELGGRERFVFLKLITGAFRVGVSEQLVIRAVAAVSELPEEVVAHRLMGGWEPSAEFYEQLVARDTRDADRSRPYPFYLAYPLEQEPDALGTPLEWQAEWKWDGIRAQVVRRGGSVFVWSRGDELMAGRFPEVEESARLLPEGTVIDGELMPWRDESALPFALLQRRIGRKAVTRKILTEVPVVLVAYDLLEFGGDDVRGRPLEERRTLLTSLIRALPASSAFRLSPVVSFESWSELVLAREGSRDRAAEGLMLKRISSPYGTGRRRGDWWKWKVDPYSADAVLIYAQPGHGRRAGLFTDYTFGVWDGEQLVPFAKAYSGLTDEEIREVDAFVRRHTIDKHGPVRVVEPLLVFEIAFEGLQRSSRHRSGVAVRFPRMARWRRDKVAADADSLETILTLLGAAERGRNA